MNRVTLLEAQPLFEELGNDQFLVQCPWINDHGKPYYPQARFDLRLRKFTCIHPCCLTRTLDEALSQLAKPVASAVSGANQKKETENEQ